VLDWAFSEEGARVDAISARHQVDYFCPECSGIVRLKRGSERIAHFFHINEHSSCRLRWKDGLHLAVQRWFAQQLDECTLERYFPEISRIADVAYHSQKTVFEIQVSPMSKEKALQRTHDYQSIGWNVIWILHAARFGRNKASPFEEALIHIPHYFTDIGFHEGKLWDELSIARNGRRKWFNFPPLRCHIDTIIVEPISKIPHNSHGLFLLRKTHWPCHLQGDWLSRPTPQIPEKNHPKIFKCLILFLRLLWLRIIGA